MNRTFTIALFVLITLSGFSQDNHWSAKRITSAQSQNESNSWLNFRTEVELDKVPAEAIAKIACDSKYWMWINGNLVVYEGQLKRGPNPGDTYYDEVDITPFLQQGDNTIAILVWYFGKDGFSHNSSGEAGVVFQCNDIGLVSDGTWMARLDRGFEHTSGPYPNYRLPESNIRFNAQKGSFDWIRPGTELKGFSGARIIAEAESPPWNKLVKRPIPLWKDYGLNDYENNGEIPAVSDGNEIICKLPYNCHISPYLEIEAPAGMVINIQTDNFDYMGLSVASVRAEYVTKEGVQQYESPGWMNGHIVKYRIPSGVRIKALKYRETGFNCEFSGYFKCNDNFYNKLWQKANRTLYVTMRDTYMDCPERERAQWWGDMVNESGEAFYALSPSAATLTEKGILELMNWQRDDGTIFSPVPQGNWDRELPGQMLASIGYFGFWNYYMNTGDKATIARVYDGVKRYLDVWKIKDNGTLVERKGDWYWGDWGEKIDKQLLFNAWYYLALKGYANMSELLDNESELSRTREEMEDFQQAFNTVFWDGKGYRTAAYEGAYDDRAQALAVVSGLANREKHPALLKIFKKSFLASPYMEKYVLEALFMMGEEEYGLQRMKERFWKMVEESEYTTLYEVFGEGVERAGDGTNNHAWSGGGLTLLSQYVCGLYPLEPAWKTFQVKPQPGFLKSVATGNETIAGKISVRVEQDNALYTINLNVPMGTQAIVCIPGSRSSIDVNGTLVFKNRAVQNELVSFEGKEDGYNRFKVGAGSFTFSALN
ncbi:MAG: alpha-L-rhamnosidase C-terminal domain-containing protein [Bacteroidota bacterium]